MRMSNAADRLISALLDFSEKESAARRISIYRDAAEVLVSEKHAQQLRCLACDLEEIDLRHRQLLLDFKRRAEG